MFDEYAHELEDAFAAFGGTTMLQSFLFQNLI
jgi:hypothetical protein